MYLPWTLPALLFSQTPLNLRPSLLNSYALLDIPTPDPPAPHGYEAIPDSHANTLQDAWYKFDAQLAADDWTCKQLSLQMDWSAALMIFAHSEWRSERSEDVLQR